MKTGERNSPAPQFLELLAFPVSRSPNTKLRPFLPEPGGYLRPRGPSFRLRAVTTNPSPAQPLSTNYHFTLKTSTQMPWPQEAYEYTRTHTHTHTPPGKLVNMNTYPHTSLTLNQAPAHPLSTLSLSHIHPHAKPAPYPSSTQLPA